MATARGTEKIASRNNTQYSTHGEKKHITIFRFYVNIHAFSFKCALPSTVSRCIGYTCECVAVLYACIRANWCACLFLSLSRYAYSCANVYACIHVCRSLHFLRASMCHSELHSDLCAIWPRIMHFTCRTQLLSRTRNCLISICKPPLTPTPFKTPACVGNGHSIIRIHSFVFKFDINKKEIHSKQQLLWEQKKKHIFTHTQTLNSRFASLSHRIQSPRVLYTLNLHCIYIQILYLDASEPIVYIYLDRLPHLHTTHIRISDTATSFQIYYHARIFGVLEMHSLILTSFFNFFMAINCVFFYHLHKAKIWVFRLYISFQFER